jgi:glycosyltransferase involved in cell wall biosynthesis
MLLEALESVFNQTYKGAQILVSDNGSTDGTDVAVSALQKSHPELAYKRHDPPIGAANWTYVISSCATPGVLTTCNRAGTASEHPQRSLPVARSSSITY